MTTVDSTAIEAARMRFRMFPSLTARSDVGLVVSVHDCILFACCKQISLSGCEIPRDRQVPARSLASRRTVPGQGFQTAANALGSGLHQRRHGGGEVGQGLVGAPGRMLAGDV